MILQRYCRRFPRNMNAVITNRNNCNRLLAEVTLYLFISLAVLNGPNEKGLPLQAEK